jgi:hypothetical protein
MKPIVFSRHALEQRRIRGVMEEEVEQTLTTGERIPAKRGRQAFRKNFPFRSEWQDEYYEVK